MPLLSVIIPVYNVENYIDKCLSSLAAQSIQNFEVIMIDDGSRDGSAQICKKYVSADSRFRYFYKENGGVSSARNVGIEKAQGEWISFVDSDDWVADNYLSSLSENKADTDIIFFGMTNIHESGISRETILPSEVCFDNREGFEKILFRLWCGEMGDILGFTWNKFFRRDVIENNNIRFDEAISYKEDEIFTLEYCRYVSSVKVLDKLLYFYRVVDNGLTKRGVRKSDLTASVVHLTENLKYYSNPSISEFIIKICTDYLATIIRMSGLSETKRLLKEYRNFTERYTQTAVLFKVNHLTQYVRYGFWIGYLYCLIRKL